MGTNRKIDGEGRKERGVNDRMSSELIAILGVGATVLVVGVAILALGWNMYSSLNARLDATQAENQRQHDAIEEVLRVFEGRITRLEERTGIGAEPAE